MASVNTGANNVTVRLRAAYDVLIDRAPEERHKSRLVRRVRQVMTGVGIPKPDVNVTIDGVLYRLTLRRAGTSEAGLFNPENIAYKHGRPVFKNSDAFHVDRHSFGRRLRHQLYRERGITVPKGKPVWHYNVKNTFTKHTSILDHAPTSGAAKVGRTLKGIRILGTVALVVTIVIDGTELALAIADDIAEHKVSKSPRTAARIAGRWGGAALGAKALGTLGAAAGTAIAPGPGTIVLGALGAIIGGIGGAILGEEMANAVVTAIEGVPELFRRVDAIFEKGRGIRNRLRGASKPNDLFDAATNRGRELRSSFPSR